jgi:hypothetical protein
MPSHAHNVTNGQLSLLNITISIIIYLILCVCVCVCVAGPLRGLRVDSPGRCLTTGVHRPSAVHV